MYLEENRFSFKVAELQQGIVRLARNQYLPGYTVVIFRRHANELFELSVQELTQFWQDVSRVAKVIFPQFDGVVECGKAVLKKGEDHAETTTDLYSRV